MDLGNESPSPTIFPRFFKVKIKKYEPDSVNAYNVAIKNMDQSPALNGMLCRAGGTGDTYLLINTPWPQKTKRIPKSYSYLRNR